MTGAPRTRSASRSIVRFLAVAAFIGAAPTALASDVFAHPATADQLLNGVLAQPAKLIANTQVIRGEFVFRRFLAELPAPLESTGRYVFARGLGIDWHTEAPLDSESIVTATGTMQRDDGAVTMQADASAQPALRTASRILTSLLTLDVHALDSTFDLFGDGADGRWEIGLKPSGAAVAAIVREATVAGGEQVERVTLHDANGDRTEITFRHVTYDAAAPSEQERARFETTRTKQ